MGIYVGRYIYICILSNGIHIIMVAGQEERSVSRLVGRFLLTRRTSIVSSLPSVTRAEIMMRSWLLLLIAARALLLLPLDSLEGRIVAR